MFIHREIAILYKTTNFAERVLSTDWFEIMIIIIIITYRNNGHYL